MSETDTPQRLRLYLIRMVFGSGKQRSAGAGIAIADSVKRFRDGLAEVAPAAEARRVTILIEPLAPPARTPEATLDQRLATGFNRNLLRHQKLSFTPS